MKKAQQEAYKRDYAQAKKEGKPFFPYAIYKDHIVAILCFAWIIGMAIWHRVEVGRPIYEATTDFVPRPEWYFFFLFELLKIFKGDNFLTPVIMATFIVPNVLMALLILTPFIDRSPERRIEKRPFAMAVAIIIFTSLAWLTYKGATSEAPAAGALKFTPSDANTEIAARVIKQEPCLSCHVIGASGGSLGPNLNNIGSQGKGVQWHIDHLKNPSSKVPGSAMPAFAALSEPDLKALATVMDGMGTKYKVD
ncbi:MAG: cbb3-type cytochrome c oxidase subunit II [Thermoleophilia bacterium]|nr:cbb3-type cytochrome c oxidase subunit II [Thermoleophilia bacterium]